MTKSPFLVLLFLCAMTSGALAEKITYYQDPVFQQLNGNDAHPMSELLGLAEEGDIRAQFIIADLYAKGKGGLSKNEKKARLWFEACAREGYSPALIRLAALAKRGKDYKLAYQWYTLAVEKSSFGKEQRWAVRARNTLVKEASLSQEDIAAAKLAAAAWKQKKTGTGAESPDARDTGKEIKKKENLFNE